LVRIRLVHKILLPAAIGLIALPSIAQETDPRILHACRETAAKAVKECRARLHNEIVEKGMTGAVAACAEHADSICGSFGQIPGLTVERVSLFRLKTADRSGTLEYRLLKSLSQRVAADKGVEEEYGWDDDAPAPTRRFVYLKALKIGPLCLSCHGPSELVQPGVRKAMLAKYDALPSGMTLGELKGAFLVSLEFPQAAPYLEKVTNSTERKDE
jgi:hypothetical protein